MTSEDQVRTILREKAALASAAHTLCSVHPGDLMALLEDARELQVLREAVLHHPPEVLMGVPPLTARHVTFRRTVYRALASDLDRAGVDHVTFLCGAQRLQDGQDGLLRTRVAALDPADPHSVARFAYRLESAVDHLQQENRPASLPPER